MNGSSYFKGFKDDTWINGIGDLFCRKGGVRWGANLSIYPSKESGTDTISLSNAPILVRKNIINPTRDYYRKDFEKAFTIATTRDWQVDLLGNCPALERRLSKEARQFCFVFQIVDGIKIYLPQFELARALFFHNGYLARSSVIHDLLNNEFAVDYDQENGTPVINVLDTCNCPVELFNDYGYRRVLAWLLMDEDARRAYESIGNNQLNYGYDVGQYRRWAFRFDPPALKNAMLGVRGNFDAESRTLLVYEVTSIRNISTDLPEHVEFFSPKFYTQINGQGQGSGFGAEHTPRHDVDDTSEVSRENKPVMISGNMTEFEFDRAVQTSKISKRKKTAGRGHKDDDEPGEASSDVSTEEQGPNGDLSSAEWNTLNEQTDDAHLFLNKFDSYFKMLDLLEEKHGCRVVKFPLRKLPAIGKCKKHLLETDQKSRCMSVVHVTAGGSGCYLLEVDTSDASKALSTKVILASAIGDIESHLYEIEKQLLKASLSWPKEHLDKLVGEDNHTWVPHQKSNKWGSLPMDDLWRWADRFFKKL
ncbi:Tn7-like element transposition protein TnsE [Shewanella algae]|uniref:Tn7-like element transposition protein TnsE n=1 Tax=Shewanella algae TaxID=38313 RepID=UPI0031F5CCE9